MGELSEKIGMTATGLKIAIENESLKLRDAVKICELTGIKLQEIADVDAKNVVKEPEQDYFSRAPRKKYIEQDIDEIKKELEKIRKELNRLDADKIERMKDK